MFKSIQGNYGNYEGNWRVLMKDYVRMWMKSNGKEMMERILLWRRLVIS
jgi:hypothetical protein